MPTEQTIAARDRWIRACSQGDDAARGAAELAIRGMRDALEALGRNLLALGYPVYRLSPPEPLLEERIARLESVAGAPVAPVLSMFWRELGEVSLVDLEDYQHVDFWAAQGVSSALEYSDALHVYGCHAWLIDELVDWREDGRAVEDYELPLAPDVRHKDNISGGPSYAVSFSPSWRPPVLNFTWSGARPASAPTGETDLLSYLRSAICECAGFPGLLGAPAFEPLRVRLLQGVEPF